MAAKERALDIFWLLGEIDRKNYQIWENLSDDQKKELSALIVMRWMAGTTDQRQIIFLNEIINLAVFNLPEHKELLLKLLTVCSSGKPKRYQWVNYKLTSTKKNKKSIELVSEHYRISLKEAEDAVKLFTPAELMEMAELQGFQKDELKELKKEVGS